MSPLLNSQNLISASVRSTNVYEENSLGVFPEEDDGVYDEKVLRVKENRVQIWGKHLMRHLQRQLSFGGYILFHGLIHHFELVLLRQICGGWPYRYFCCV